MADLPLSKCWNPDDLKREEFDEILPIVDRELKAFPGQGEVRRWEYAMALQAREVWLQQDYEARGHANRMHGGRIADVGGGGSPFYRMLDPYLVDVIDPKEGRTLAQYMTNCWRIAQEVYCLSVLEHVPAADYDQFLYHLSCLVAPGGLLFLTFDYWDPPMPDPLPSGVTGVEDHPDVAMNHWMRERIFTPGRWVDLIDTFTGCETYAHGGRDFRLLGDGPDMTYQMFSNWNYAVASLALVKRR